MLHFPKIDPVAIDLGTWSLPFVGVIHPQVHWYGLTYLLAFVGCYWLLVYRTRKMVSAPIRSEQVGDLLFYAALGVVLGGRVGYILFYNLDTFLQNPFVLFRVWEGGMSFHGGFLGVLLAVAWYGHKFGTTFWQLMDLIAPTVPFGLFCGRIGNFINAELWGRVTDVPWGMVFPNGGPLPRHPSMLYEACLEGIVLFVILWIYSAKPRPRMAVSAVFALGYGLFRFAVEFVRQPDQHIGFIAFDWLTMGMLLSLPMVGVGLVLFFLVYRGARRS